MSYDLEVWSVRPIENPAFRHAEKWQQEESYWTYSAPDWQIVVGRSNKVLPEDVPDEGMKTLPGIEYLTQLQLEGKSTEQARKLAHSTALDLAKAAHGVVFDPQEETIRTPSGVKRFVKPGKQEKFSVLSLSWWFLDSVLLANAGRESFVNFLERNLPEALPRRYGLYEPPQHVLEQTGKAHFIQFLGENLHQTKVWYPHRPVVYVSLGCPNPLGASKRGFRTNHLRIDFEHAVLEQPGWAKTIYAFWQDVSRLVKPFYGDVRILDGYLWVRGASSTGRDTELHPIPSWWWRGIPKTLGNAVVLGEVYQKLWPRFSSAATSVDGLAFASTRDWSVKRDLAIEMGGVPAQLMQPKARDTKKWFHALWPVSAKQKYPKLWPFDDPFQVH